MAIYLRRRGVSAPPPGGGRRISSPQHGRSDEESPVGPSCVEHINCLIYMESLPETQPKPFRNIRPETQPNPFRNIRSEKHFRHRPETNLPEQTTRIQLPNTSEGTAPQHRGPPDAASEPSDAHGPGTVGEARPPHLRETGAGARASAPTTGRGGGRGLLIYTNKGIIFHGT